MKAAAAIALGLVALAGVARADGAVSPAGDAEDADAIVPDRRAVKFASEANLEPERLREGLAIGVALGGSLQVSRGDDTVFGNANGTGGGFDLRIGTSASERLAWFVDLVVAAAPGKGDTVDVRTTSALTIGAQQYVKEAIWLRAGAGFTRLDNAGDPDHPPLGGLGFLGGGGIDLARRGRFALSGDVTVLASLYKGGMVTSAIFALGATWY